MCCPCHTLLMSPSRSTLPVLATNILFVTLPPLTLLLPPSRLQTEEINVVKHCRPCYLRSSPEELCLRGSLVMYFWSHLILNDLLFASGSLISHVPKILHSTPRFVHSTPRFVPSTPRFAPSTPRFCIPHQDSLSLC